MRLSDQSFLPIWQKAVDEFNSEQFFECHETLEAAWLIFTDPTEKAFLQGIIQAAAAMIKLKERNRKGLKSTLDKLLPKLELSLDELDTLGFLNLEKLLQQLQAIHQFSMDTNNSNWPEVLTVSWRGF